MCMNAIVDASAFRHLCEPLRNSAGHQFRAWIERGHGRIVYSGAGGAYARELNKHCEAFQLIQAYDERGRAEDIDAEHISAALSQIPGPPVRKSNDAHILALAVASRATVLFSCDNPLREDFAHIKVIDKVGQRERRSVPVLLQSPEDTTKAPNRRKFFERRKCPASQ